MSASAEQLLAAGAMGFFYTFRCEVGREESKVAVASSNLVILIPELGPPMSRGATNIHACHLLERAHSLKP